MGKWFVYGDDADWNGSEYCYYGVGNVDVSCAVDGSGSQCHRLGTYLPGLHRITYLILMRLL